MHDAMLLDPCCCYSTCVTLNGYRNHLRPNLSDLLHYRAVSGRLLPVFIIEIQTLPEDVDRLLDAVIEVHPLDFGQYHRNASVSAIGMKTARSLG